MCTFLVLTSEEVRAIDPLPANGPASTLRAYVIKVLVDRRDALFVAFVNLVNCSLAYEDHVLYLLLLEWEVLCFILEQHE